MLAQLGARPGHRVLEIGTGTGYNAALLAHRLGDDGLVTTIDLEPEITESARRHLEAAGHRPVVVTGDGARGVPGRAPFDRIIATCTLPSVPRAWLDQCRPGARVLTPFATGLVVLTVADAGHAEGRFLATPAYFVPLRGPGRRAAARRPGPRAVPLPAGADPGRPGSPGGVRALGAGGPAATGAVRDHRARRAGVGLAGRSRGTVRLAAARLTRVQGEGAAVRPPSRTTAPASAGRAS
jgi:SAM-dependent methyltransferase